MHKKRYSLRKASTKALFHGVKGLLSDVKIGF